MLGSVTVTVHFAVKPPSAVVTVMVAVPVPTPVTTPFVLTVATSVLLLFQLTRGLSAFCGSTVAVSVASSRRMSESSLLSSVTPVTATAPPGAVLSPYTKPKQLK